MHTSTPPKQKLLDPALDGRIVGDVREFLERRIELALARGVAFEQLILDPGPDFSKTPAQTVEVLRALDALSELGRPILLAVSRKDFVGALTGRGPRDRLPGTLAALGFGVQAGAQLLRVHDVAAAADFLTVWEALSGDVRRRLGPAAVGRSALGPGRRRPHRALDSGAPNRWSLAQRDRSPPIIHRPKEHSDVHSRP